MSSKGNNANEHIPGWPTYENPPRYSYHYLDRRPPPHWLEAAIVSGRAVSTADGICAYEWYRADNNPRPIPVPVPLGHWIHEDEDGTVYADREEHPIDMADKPPEGAGA